MPRRWDRRELEPRRASAAESARLSRYAARLLAATATATAMTTLVVGATDAAIIAPEKRAAEEAARRAARPTAAPPPAVPPTWTPPSPARSPRPAPPAAAPRTGAPRVSGPAAPPAAPPLPVPPAPSPDPLPPPTEPPAPPPPEPPAVVTLSDDDEEQPLFAARDLVPGSRRTRCLTVTYAGTAEVVQVQVLVEGGGELARWLRVHVDLGDVPGRDCAAFVPVRPLLDGTLEALADQTATGAAMTYEARSGVPVGLRVTTELPADVPSSAAGAAAYGSFRFGVS